MTRRSCPSLLPLKIEKGHERLHQSRNSSFALPHLQLQCGVSGFSPLVCGEPKHPPPPPFSQTAALHHVQRSSCLPSQAPRSQGRAPGQSTRAGGSHTHTARASAEGALGASCRLGSPSVVGTRWYLARLSRTSVRRQMEAGSRCRIKNPLS